MKTYLNIGILAAGLTGFGAASAWGQGIKAEVPFGFRLQNTEMPAGEYSVKQLQSGTPALVLSNLQTHKSALVLTSPLSASADARPRLTFQCGENGCVLAEVWGATSSAGVRVSSPSRNSRQREHLAIVYGKRSSASE